MTPVAGTIRRTAAVVLLLAVATFGTSTQTRAQSQADSRSVISALGSFQTERAAQLFKNGASPNLLDQESHSPLMYAAVADDIALAKLLIELGADVNYRVPDSGLTPLMQAAAIASDDFVRLLVDNGAKVNEVASTGSTALHEALKKNRHLTAAFLLQRGASPNVTIRRGSSTIYHMIHFNDEVGAKLLVKHGVDLSQRGPANLPALAGKTPVEFAESQGRTNMVEILRTNPAAIVLPSISNTELKPETTGPMVMTTGKVIAVEGHRFLLKSLQGNLLLRWFPTTSIGTGPGSPLSPATAPLMEDLRRHEVVTVRHAIGNNRVASIVPGPMSIGSR